jgi:hypothetical protein
MQSLSSFRNCVRMSNYLVENAYHLTRDGIVAAFDLYYKV